MEEAFDKKELDRQFIKLSEKTYAKWGIKNGTLYTIKVKPTLAGLIYNDLLDLHFNDQFVDFIKKASAKAQGLNPNEL